MRDTLIENGMIVQGEPADLPSDYEPDRCERCGAIHGLEQMVSGGRLCKKCMKAGYEILRNLVVKDVSMHSVMIDMAVDVILEYIREELNIKEEA